MCPFDACEPLSLEDQTKWNLWTVCLSQAAKDPKPNELQDCEVGRGLYVRGRPVDSGRDRRGKRCT